MSCFVGIDIAAKSFDLVIKENSHFGKVIKFEQTKKGNDKVIQQLITKKPSIIVMEATGVYYLNLRFDWLLKICLLRLLILLATKSLLN